MNAEFNWWLLIVGLGVGAGLTWLILSDLAHREDELTERETAEEVAWVAESLAAVGRPTSPETIERVLDLHRSYVQRDRPRTPEEDAPEAVAPEVGAPEGDAPEGEVPKAEAPGGDASGGDASGAG